MWNFSFTEDGETCILFDKGWLVLCSTKTTFHSARLKCEALNRIYYGNDPRQILQDQDVHSTKETADTDISGFRKNANIRIDPYGNYRKEDQQKYGSGYKDFVSQRQSHTR